jgi:hypothetical protein
MFSDLDSLNIHFETNPGNIRPIVHKLLELLFIEKNGTILFEGICNVKESELPYKIGLTILKHTKEDLIRRDRYLIEISKIELIEDTSKYWYDEEMGGDICLFPTGKYKLHFKII